MKVLMPLPCTDFDPSEAALSWAILAAAGHEIVFTTPDGRPARTDPVMVSGIGLDAWSLIPGLRRLKVIGLALRADKNARAAYRELVDNAAFRSPLRYDWIDSAHFGALLLPGGHAQGMREYLESSILQRVVAAFFDAGKPVAAICHGVVLAARGASASSGRSVLHGRKTTALTWQLERSAWRISRWMRWWDRDYYRTYREQTDEPAGYRSVQAEVTRALASSADFLDVAAGASNRFRKSSGLFRDSPHDARPAFVVRDGNYVSARWPGDVHTFAHTFAAVLAEPAGNSSEEKD
ncbi:MAG TPA: type 1 glutamine amidotransferase domain-containing protein [Rudaea sp.]|jgi:putative intracellular protease/amidase